MSKILVTGGAGFIGSNLVDHFLGLGHEVVCLDNLSTGYRKNIEHNLDNPNFAFIEGDIRDIQTCTNAVKDCDYVSHQAALGSVPRSIKDPITTNAVNIDGFLNIITAARDAKVKRFVYASSSSVYGDSPKLPKVEHEIGTPLSPYAVTKYVNELYANVFAKTYKMQCIGLRYFNVFGKRQDPNGAYAAVIPKWVKQLINHERPVINGDGSYSRDFTYIDNVLQANERALFTSEEQILKGQKENYNIELENHKYLLQDSAIQTYNYSSIHSNDFYFSEIFNIAYGGNTTLLELFKSFRENLAKFDNYITGIEPEFGPYRIGDIPHSQANIIKAINILGYYPIYSAENGLKLSSEWYFNNLK
ncbi:MAG TPA: SDR family oxidoreductase [Ignavibacteriaceae bacterium]|nr:SDR family oxidoreductase [Ignavibacteriaceae bacterium]